MSGVMKDFFWHATSIDACSAELVSFTKGDAQSALGGESCGPNATGSATDDDEVVIERMFHELSSFKEGLEVFEFEGDKGGSSVIALTCEGRLFDISEESIHFGESQGSISSEGLMASGFREYAKDVFFDDFFCGGGVLTEGIDDIENDAFRDGVFEYGWGGRDSDAVFFVGSDGESELFP